MRSTIAGIVNVARQSSTAAALEASPQL